MNPKEYAEYLIKKFDIKHVHKIGLTVSMYSSQIKACAIACAEEVIGEIGLPVSEYDVERIKYWNQVKTEIENL